MFARPLCLSLSILTAALTAPTLAQGLSLGTDQAKQAYSVGVDIGKNVKQNRPDADIADVLKGVNQAMTSDVRSFSFGLQIGSAVKADGVNLDVAALLAGIKEGAGADSKYQLTDKQIADALTEYQQTVNKLRLQAIEKLAASNLKEAENFLLANKAKSGVQSLASGLQYKVVTEGKGKSPGLTDTVLVHYHGTFINGDIFDSSVERGEPVNLQVNRVIDGWSQALQHMKVGGKWIVYIHPSLAYGDKPVEESPIGPNQALVFEIELLSIQ